MAGGANAANAASVYDDAAYAAANAAAYAAANFNNKKLTTKQFLRIWNKAKHIK